MENSTDGGHTIYMMPYVEVPVLLVIIIVGVIGNSFVIGAVLVEKTLRNMGVAFIINLAIADLVITAWYLPHVLSNVLHNYTNSLEHVWWFCKVTGFTVSWCCQVSMMTLMFIAFSRYWKLKSSSAYRRWFSKNYTLLMIGFIWIETFFIALPLIVGWGDSGSLLGFDTDIVSCMWNDEKAPQYNIFLVIVAIFLPLIATIYFYALIYRHVQKTKLPPRKEVSPTSHRKTYESGKEKIHVTRAESDISSSAMENNASGAVRTHHARHNSLNSHKMAGRRKADERERSLVLTLVVVGLFFLIFWTPYAIIVLISTDVPPLAKRACGWLALSNSAVNSIIYGVLNRHFRRGYVKLMERIWLFLSVCFCCEQTAQYWRRKFSRSSQKEGKWSETSGKEYKQHSVTFN